MINIEQAIIVEGKYDKIKLGQLFNATIVSTEGFGIFADSEKLAYIRELAKKCGIIIFTDPDGAGLVIRNYLKGAVSKGIIYHAYIPDIEGKEKRKRLPGKAGLLGVEGVPDDLLISAITSCGISCSEGHGKKKEITKADMYALGLSGGKDSVLMRKKLSKRLLLPSNISANGLLDALNTLYSLSELQEMVADLQE
ncbi:MAG: DUF4093 domain-containing protein [Clostridiaceae bacterium]|nr:DUF4093 domain-containing protein [Clostridiaceae bacterium]